MKALVHLNANAKKVITRRVAEQLLSERDDIAKRCQYIWVLGMIQAGLSSRTVRRVIDVIPAITAKYGEWQADDVGDFAMQYLIRSQSGIELPLTSKEVER